MSVKPDSVDNGIGATELSADRMSDREELASLVGQLLAEHWIAHRGGSEPTSACRPIKQAAKRKSVNPRERLDDDAESVSNTV